MLARVISEKFSSEGKQMRRIVKFEGVDEERYLPNEYLDSKDAFYLSEQNEENLECPYIMLGTGHSVHSNKWAGLSVSGDKEVQTVYEEDEMTEEEFQKLVAFMRKCGERLTEIKRRNSWKGCFEFVIPYTDDSMSIHFEKFVKDGEKYVRITGWSNIPIPANLPAKYLTGNAVFYLHRSGEDKDNAIIIAGKGYAIKADDKYPNYLWEEGQRYISDCAKHLKNVLELEKPVREETKI